MQVWHATVEPVYLLRWKLCKKNWIINNYRTYGFHTLSVVSSHV